MIFQLSTAELVSTYEKNLGKVFLSKSIVDL